MSETVVTIAILAAMFAWPPFLQIVCPPCSRYLHRRSRPTTDGEPAPSLNTAKRAV